MMKTHFAKSVAAGSQLRIAYFTNSITMGGMENHVVELAFAVAKTGCEVAAIVPGDKAVMPFVERLREANIAVHLLDLAGDQPKQQLAVQLMRLRNLLRTERFNVFHQHRTGPYHGKWACLAARLAGVPAIVATEHLPAHRLYGWARGINAIADQLVDCIVTVCDLDRDQQLRETWRQESKVVTIHNGIDLSRFRPDEVSCAQARSAQGLDADAPILGVLARLIPVKGVTHLLKALPSLIQQWPKLVLLIGGDGYERQALEAEATALGISSSVKFLGHCEDVIQVLRVIDLLVLPSELESCPIVLLEAMAMRRPAVATDVGGVSEVVLDGVTGFLVPPRNPQALSSAIARCLRDGQLATMGSSGRTLVEKLFTAEVMTTKTIALYRTLLANAELR